MADFNETQTGRRQFLKSAIAATVALSSSTATRRLRAADELNDDSKPLISERQIRDYLTTLLLTQDDVDKWLANEAFPFCMYDPELGYIHIDRDFQEGLDGAICRYRYDNLGARQMLAYADQPCRINTYGDSFTSCEQVSDGETWQEKLAAHLGEPVRNYGIGGYSVYQAYLRMLREEKRAPATYIIFNIFDDDHVRNLHGWQRVKFGVNSKSPNPAVPHVKVDLKAGKITERPNPCPTSESVSDLCDLDRVFALFQDDFYLRNQLGKAALVARGKTIPATDYDDQRLMRHGIFASTQIVGRVNDFAQQNGKHVLFVLSYGAYTLKQFIDTGRRFDQTMVDFLQQEKLPYIDLMKTHAADAMRFKGTTDEALGRYFIGHYNPLGNHFCAHAIKNALVTMLDPKPPAYGGK